VWSVGIALAVGIAAFWLLKRNSFHVWHGRDEKDPRAIATNRERPS
jgi:hypothetical protein